MTPLALSREQLEILHGVVAQVPRDWQSRFLSAVADALTLVPNPTNRELIEIVSATRRAMAIGSGPGAYARRQRAAS